MIKPSYVIFASEELEKEFENLPENDIIKKAINRAIVDLKQNAFCATPIPKKLIPIEYIEKYNAENLWKYDLPNGWRLLYTINVENKVKLISAILEWFDHKDYERRFSY